MGEMFFFFMGFGWSPLTSDNFIIQGLRKGHLCRLILESEYSSKFLFNGTKEGKEKSSDESEKVVMSVCLLICVSTCYGQSLVVVFSATTNLPTAIC